jgi:hypothetical protein
MTPWEAVGWLAIAGQVCEEHEGGTLQVRQAIDAVLGPRRSLYRCEQQRFVEKTRECRRAAVDVTDPVYRDHLMWLARVNAFCAAILAEVGE